MIKLSAKNNIKSFQKKLDKKFKKIARLDIANKKISIFLDKWVQDNFKTEGGKVGGWAEFALGGRFVDGKLDESAKLLQDTGVLRASHLPFSSKLNAGIGSKIPYAKQHNEGKGRLPQRRTLPEINEVDTDIEKIYDQHIKKAIK